MVRGTTVGLPCLMVASLLGCGGEVVERPSLAAITAESPTVVAPGDLSQVEDIELTDLVVTDTEAET